MTESSKDARRIMGNSGLNELDLIGNRTFTVGVAADSDPEFKAYIMAAGSTYAAGNHSVDNILRRHRSKWIGHFEKKAEADEQAQWD